jgi:hypothetical protein
MALFLRKYFTYKNISISLFILFFLFCNIIAPVTGIFGGNYYQYSSGGFNLANLGANSNYFVKDFVSSFPENHYFGTMNLILIPLSAIFKNIDIRALGFIYFIILLLAFIMLLRILKFEKEWQNWLFSFFCVFVFSDFAYLLHLNSPNIEPAFLTAIILLTTIILCQFYGKKPTIINSILFSLLAFFVGGLKTSYYFIAPLLMLMLFSTFYLRKDLLYKAVNIILFLAVSLSSIWFFGNGVSPILKKIDIVNSVFYGALKEDAKNEDFKKLKLPENYINNSGKSYYEIENKEINIDTNYMDIWRYYLTSPKKYLDKLELSANNGYEIRPRYLSNYENGAPKLKNGWTLYSEFKRRFIQPDFWVVLAVLFGTILFSSLNIKKENDNRIKSHYLYLIIACVVAFSSFITPVVLQGEAELARNLFFYNVFFDIILINIVVGGAIVAAKRRDVLKDKYGLK